MIIILPKILPFPRLAGRIFVMTYFFYESKDTELTCDTVWAVFLLYVAINPDVLSPNSVSISQ